MAKLTIDFREGFFRTPVIVHIDGREAYRADAITTRMQIGLAARVCLEIGSGPFRLQVGLPDSGRTFITDIDAAEDTFVGVDLDDQGQATIRVQGESFRYM